MSLFPTIRSLDPGTYGIFTYSFTINLKPNVGKYSSPMDSMTGTTGIDAMYLEF